MSDYPIHIQIIIQKIIKGAAGSEELDELLRWIESDESHRRTYWVISALGLPATDDLEAFPATDAAVDADDRIIDDILRQSDVLEKLFAGHSKKRNRPGPSFYIRRIAAVILFILLIGGIYLWREYGGSRKENLSAAAAFKKTIIVPPGTNKAILTLADGSSVALNGSSTGIIARQGAYKIEKTADGAIIYAGNKSLHGNNITAYNTLSIPRGGQYFVTLPDGTKVWLNAASELKYPVVFTDTLRQVYLEGEAYFEVAKQLKKSGKGRVPFIVHITNHLNPSLDAKVEVLGTHFDIQAYPDEPKIKTTLLQGKVNFYTSPHAKATPLTPGFQVVDEINGNKTELSKVNVNEAIAWKNGFFDFNKMDIKAVLLQLSRWYNVTVEYKGAVPGMTFYGKMQRSLYLNQVLDALQMEGVHFKIEAGNRLIVMP